MFFITSIGMFLIFGLLMWFNVNQMPIEESSSNVTVKSDQKIDDFLEDMGFDKPINDN